jgi:hypothetical protein
MLLKCYHKSTTNTSLQDILLKFSTNLNNNSLIPVCLTKHNSNKVIKLLLLTVYCKDKRKLSVYPLDIPVFLSHTIRTSTTGPCSEKNVSNCISVDYINKVIDKRISLISAVVMLINTVKEIIDYSLNSS